MWLLISIMLTLISLCGLGLIRNMIVFSVRQRAIDAVYNNGTIMDENNIYDSGEDYNSQMLDLRKWTFKQFYPEL